MMQGLYFLRAGPGEAGFITFAPYGSKLGVAAVETGGKQGSPGALHFTFESVSHSTQKTSSLELVFCVASLAEMNP